MVRRPFNEFLWTGQVHPFQHLVSSIINDGIDERIRSKGAMSIQTPLPEVRYRVKYGPLAVFYMGRAGKLCSRSIPI